MNIEQKSTLEVSIELMQKKKKPQNAIDIIKETLELKGIDYSDETIATQLYIDITCSDKFIYCGEGQWDLKERQEISLYDKDGAFFSSGIVEEDDDDFVTADDYEVDTVEEEDEVHVEEDDVHEEYTEEPHYDDDNELGLDESFVTYSKFNDDVDDLSETFLDEDKYNDYMDDYEDLYDE